MTDTWHEYECVDCGTEISCWCVDPKCGTWRSTGDRLCAECQAAESGGEGNG